MQLRSTGTNYRYREMQRANWPSLGESPSKAPNLFPFTRLPRNFTTVNFFTPAAGPTLIIRKGIWLSIDDDPFRFDTSAFVLLPDGTCLTWEQSCTKGPKMPLGRRSGRAAARRAAAALGTSGGKNPLLFEPRPIYVGHASCHDSFAKLEDDSHQALSQGS
jgi:hypothetical protein